jgi:UDP-N-acetylmuramate: L-alanyl-gamma-D-glutamyl-meso-diaminopimelate ligase
VELHTFSSLNKKFLPQYKDTLKNAQTPVVYFNPEKVKSKKLEPISGSDIKSAFANPKIQVFDSATELESFILSQQWKEKNLLLMSSGNWGGINLRQLSDKVVAA